MKTCNELLNVKYGREDWEARFDTLSMPAVFCGSVLFSLRSYISIVEMPLYECKRGIWVMSSKSC